MLTFAAHLIRNRESRMARAVCAIESVSRWAVTGTPLQNYLNDLAALVKFLRVYPYSEKRLFDADISQPWKDGRADEAVKRLKRLAGCLVLRRPEATVQLPPRRDRAYYVELQPKERELYNQVRTQARQRLDDKSSSFTSVLQQIEAMRMVCNLGLLYPTRHDASGMDQWQDAAQSVLNFCWQMGGIQCHKCSCNPDATGCDVDSSRATFSRCLRFICSNCFQGPPGCGHGPSCPTAYVSTSTSVLEEPSIPVSLSDSMASAYRPTKVRALVEDLKTLPGDVKR